MNSNFDGMLTGFGLALGLFLFIYLLFRPAWGKRKLKEDRERAERELEEVQKGQTPAYNSLDRLYKAQTEELAAANKKLKEHDSEVTKLKKEINDNATAIGALFVDLHKESAPVGSIKDHQALVLAINTMLADARGTLKTVCKHSSLLRRTRDDKNRLNAGSCTNIYDLHGTFVDYIDNFAQNLKRVKNKLEFAEIDAEDHDNFANKQRDLRRRAQAENHEQINANLSLAGINRSLLTATASDRTTVNEITREFEGYKAGYAAGRPQPRTYDDPKKKTGGGK